MRIKETYIVLVLSTLICAPATSQTDTRGAVSAGQSNIEMPQIQEPAAPSPEETTGFMSGDKPFSLTVEPNGELLYNFNQETNELESIVAKRGVVFSSEDMTLNADHLTYDAATSKLVATGEKVIVKQGEVIATCQLFRYFPSDQSSELTGTPLLYNRTRDGKVTTTAGHKINIVRVDGRPQVRVQAGPRSAALSSAGTGATPNVINVPAEGTNSVMSIGDAPPDAAPGKNSGQSGPAPAPGGTEPGTVRESAPAPVSVPGAASPGPRSQNSGSMLGIPSLGEDKPVAKRARSNRIDVGNAEDVRSFSKTASKN